MLMDFATEKLAVQYRLDVNSSKKDNRGQPSSDDRPLEMSAW